MLEFKSVTTFVRFDAKRVVTRVMVNLFISIERTTAIKSPVLI
jgi:hypothetical protein